MKERRKEIKRGDLYYYDFGIKQGSIQSGNRPVLVIQADDFNIMSPTILVAPLTSVIKKKYLPSHIVLWDTDVLPETSMVMIEQLSTVNKADLTDYIGMIGDEAVWRKINAAIRKSFGLWKYKADDERDVHCLCHKHMREYMKSGEYIVHRKDGWSRKKDRCDKCDDYGYDYIIQKKRRSGV